MDVKELHPKFQPGDPVSLNLGGPKLFVEENILDEKGAFTGEVRCSWIDNNERHSDLFKQEFLVLKLIELY